MRQNVSTHQYISPKSDTSRKASRTLWDYDIDSAIADSFGGFQQCKIAIVVFVDADCSHTSFRAITYFRGIRTKHFSFTSRWYILCDGSGNSEERQHVPCDSWQHSIHLYDKQRLIRLSSKSIKIFYQLHELAQNLWCQVAGNKFTSPYRRTGSRALPNSIHKQIPVPSTFCHRAQICKLNLDTL